MAYDDKGKVVSLKAAASIGAGRVVYVPAANTVAVAVTNTSLPIGITADFAESGGSCPVVVSGIAKCYCADSVAAGEIVGMSTDGAGGIRGVASANATATTTNIPVVGIALEGGTAGSMIPVLITPRTLR
jgi:predicted RecA/RadA family phage recombinase